MSTDAREAAVLERIEAFRRRRPRLTDEIVTLAHGAGGKSSAALVDAVFLEAFSQRRPRAARATPPGSTCPAAIGSRSAPTPSSCDPASSPGARSGTSPCTAPSTTSPCSAPGRDGCRPRSSSRRGSRSRSSATSWPTWPRRPGSPGSPSWPATRRSSTGAPPTASTSRPPASACSRTDGRSGADLVQPGDVVLVSGTIADHGMAVMLARGDLALEADIRSDTAPLGDLMEALLAAAPSTRWLRDPTRGGLGTVCNELAKATNLAVVLDEALLPIDPAVSAACDLLGIDPLYVANEGKLVAIVAPDEADAALAALRAHPIGAGAAVIGEINADPEGIVVLLTTFGGTRIVDMLVGDPLPRIC